MTKIKVLVVLVAMLAGAAPAMTDVVENWGDDSNVSAPSISSGNFYRGGNGFDNFGSDDINYAPDLLWSVRRLTEETRE
jgi:hypothetical protein